jgi:catechol-2,3-dioxygenase
MRVTQIDHVELEVPDRYAAARWYQAVLGFEICAEYESWAGARYGPLMISTDDDHGKSFSVYFSDPYGNRLEVTTYDYEAVREKVTAGGEPL